MHSHLLDNGVVMMDNYREFHTMDVSMCVSNVRETIELMIADSVMPVVENYLLNTFLDEDNNILWRKFLIWKSGGVNFWDSDNHASNGLMKVYLRIVNGEPEPRIPWIGGGINPLWLLLEDIEEYRIDPEYRRCGIFRIRVLDVKCVYHHDVFQPNLEQDDN